MQVAPAALRFEQGTDQIAGLRLGAKGLFRWYARCCNTPLGNTVGTAIPLVGIVAQAFDTDGGADRVVGSPTVSIMGQFAVDGPPPGSTGWNVGLYARIIRLVLGWRLGGQAWPHPFFNRADGQPMYPIEVLSVRDRDALRAYCGPRPTARN